MGEGPCVLVLRVLEPPSAQDVVRLTDFGATHGLRFYVQQEGGAETIRPLPGQRVELYYDLPGADIRLYFQPTDFTQVNLVLNGLLVEQALELLAPRSDERILDLPGSGVAAGDGCRTYPPCILLSRDLGAGRGPLGE